MYNQDKKFDIESMPFFPVKKQNGHLHSTGQFLTSSYFKRRNYNSHQTPERYQISHPNQYQSEYFYPFEQAIDTKTFEEEKFYSPQTEAAPDYPDPEDLDGNSIDEFIENNYNCGQIADSDYISDDSLKQFIKNLNQDAAEKEAATQATAAKSQTEVSRSKGKEGNSIQQIQKVMDENQALTLEKQLSIQKYFKNSKKIEKIKKSTYETKGEPEPPLLNESVVSFGLRLEKRISRHSLSNKMEYIESKKKNKSLNKN